ncbi:polynucleotide kinase-phosphatase [Bacillus sp. D386]|uniref:polynucleotide kinase-phosphatase n=1 Tax=Bacillus sp. D386 TaxID=2587155 RepID=UPI00111FF8D8|nr:polynucleotide kinase-phosphatase [Bacillus sp. D386]
MNINIPSAGIILLVGPSNSGKTTLLSKLINNQTLLPSEVVSSDAFRKIVGDTDFIDWKNRSKTEADYLVEHYHSISKKAFEVIYSVIEARCQLNKLTFIDATHLKADDRKKYIDIARKHHLPIIAIILDTDQQTLLERDEKREQPRGKRRIKQQFQTFKSEKRFIKKEGFRAIYAIKDIDEVYLHRMENPLYMEVGSGLDLIGDIHGCYEEMIELLEKLGYQAQDSGLYIHPNGRRFVSVGDIMSRGPYSLKTMRFFERHIEHGLAYMIDSNHGWKIARWLDGRKVTLKHGDEQTADEFKQFEDRYGFEEANILKNKMKKMLIEAPSHYVFLQNDVPVLVCTHAGIKDDYIGRQSQEISDFCRYGDTDGFDEAGKPRRKDWFVNHNSSPLIIWGHDPKPQPLRINNTINIDQGVVFGGQLTAFRYPEEKFVSVKARQDYSNSDDNPLMEWERNRLNPPNIGSFINGYSVLTEEFGEVKLYKEHVKAAIDTVSHFTIPIEKLLYIPPTMSPTPKPSQLPDYLEHPREAIDYYRSHGIERMIAEKKHMGSRAILLLFKDQPSALHYVGYETLGVIYTRRGRCFFDSITEEKVVHELHSDLINHGYFEKYDTDFVLLDAEIMPWNLKAKELIQNQYAHVAENAIMDRDSLKNKLEQAVSANSELHGWLNEYTEKLANAQNFKEVYETYCWEVEDIHQIQIAPFHVLAHSKETFFDHPHLWHMHMNHEFGALSKFFIETEYKVIDSEASEQDVIEWWREMTEEGHEGIVIKPETFIAKERGKLLQPAIKVRGRKYLSIIYGMDYLSPANLARLKNRNTSKKQKLALREFVLGVEGIRRFVNGDSLQRIHECVLGTLSLESDPVDPRL